MGLPSLCAEEPGPREAVGDMTGESDVDMAWMRELSCARVIAPSVPYVSHQHSRQPRTNRLDRMEPLCAAGRCYWA